METTDKFPKSWSKCPSCGSEKRVIGQLREDLIAVGKWNPQTQGALIRQVALLHDPSRPSISLSIPAVDVKIDICSECGAIYAFEANLTEMKQSMKPAQHQGQVQGS